MNNLVTTEQIPDYEQIPLTNLHPDYKKVAQMNALIASVVGLTFLLGVFFIFDTTEKYLEKLAKSGCMTLSFGLESILQESLNSMNKSWARVSDYPRLIKNIQLSGFTNEWNLI